MSLYRVAANASASGTKIGGKDAVIVQANSTNEAKALAKAYFDGDSDSKWTNATVTDLSAVPVLTDWVFRVQVDTGTPIDVTVTGDADDTLDAIMAKMVIALNATAINAASYNTGTNVLTVAAIADGIGDKTITVTVTRPAALFPSHTTSDTLARVDDYTWAQADVVASKTDGGIAAAALLITFSTSWVVPGVIDSFTQNPGA